MTRKFLSLKMISLVLTVVMLASAIAPLSVFAIPEYSTTTETNLWTAPEGVAVYNASKITEKPTIDGAITSEDGYGAAIVPGNINMTSTAANVIASADNTRASSFNYYFSYDDENIYLAFEETGASWDDETDADTTPGNNFNEFLFRNNYRFRFGFDLDDVNQMLQFGGGSTNGTSPTSGPGWRVIFYSNGDKTGNVTANDGDKVMEFVTEFKMSKHYVPSDNKNTGVYADVTGDFTSQSGNQNSFAPYTAVVEMTLNKEKLLAFSNQYCGTNYASLPDAMYFSMVTTAYSWKDTNYNDSSILTNGQNQFFATDIRGKQAGYAAYGATAARQYFPGVIMFNGDGTKTIKRPAEVKYTFDYVKGQQFFDAGESARKNGTSAELGYEIDGVMSENEKYVKVTDGLEASTLLQGKGIYNNVTTIGENASEFNDWKDKLATLDYYVAETEDKIHLVVKETAKKWGDTKLDNHERSFYSFTFGFDPNDYKKTLGFSFGYRNNEQVIYLINAQGTGSYTPEKKWSNNNTATTPQTQPDYFKYYLQKYKVSGTTKTALTGNDNADVKAAGYSYETYIEFQFDKQYIADTFGLNVDAVGDVLWVAAAPQMYIWKEAYTSFVTTASGKGIIPYFGAYKVGETYRAVPHAIVFDNEQDQKIINQSNGQKTFVAGDNVYKPISSTDANYPFELNGVIGENEGYVKVVDGLKPSAFLNTRADISPNNANKVNINMADYEGKLPTLDYYVAETNDKIHVVIKETGSKWGNTATQTMQRSYYSFRFGFDPNDYSNAITVRWGSGTGERAVMWSAISGGVSVNTDLTNNGIVHVFLKKNKVSATGVESAWVNNTNGNLSSKASDTCDISYVAYIELEFDKAGVASLYNQKYGKTVLNAENVGGTMWITATNPAYRFDDSTSTITGNKINEFVTIPAQYTNSTEASGGSITNNFSNKSVAAFYGVHKDGAKLPDGRTCEVIPHEIVLGSEREIDGCSFTKKVETEAYYAKLIKPCTETETGEYYYACEVDGHTHMGVKTYTGAQIVSHKFTKEEAKADALKAEATCHSYAVYYKSCSDCGLVNKSDTATFEYEAGGKKAHTWSTEYTTDNVNHYHICTVCASLEPPVIVQNEETKGEHNFKNIVDDKYKVPGSSVSCTTVVEYYKSCEICGLSAEDVLTENATFTPSTPAGHAWAQPNETDRAVAANIVKYPTCTADGEYYWICYNDGCGINSKDVDAQYLVDREGNPIDRTTVIVGTATDHNYDANSTPKGNDADSHWWTCTNVDLNNDSAVCGEIVGDIAHEYGIALDLTALDADQLAKLLYDEGNCHVASTYRKVCKCYVVGFDNAINQNTTPETAFNGEVVPDKHEVWTTTYFTKEGDNVYHYQICKPCSEDATPNTVYNEETKVEHVFDYNNNDAQYKVENSVPDCTTAAQYYKSCEACGLSSKGIEGKEGFFSSTKTGEVATGHTWVRPVDDPDTAENELDLNYVYYYPTCLEDGIYYFVCDVCGISAEDATEGFEADEPTFTLENSKLGHAYDTNNVPDTYDPETDTHNKHWWTCTNVDRNTNVRCDVQLGHTEHEMGLIDTLEELNAMLDELSEEAAKVMLEKLLVETGNCQTPTTYYKVCRCGKIGPDVFEGETESEIHDYFPDRVYNADFHWKVCACSKITVPSDHAFDGDQCTVCGYVRASAPSGGGAVVVPGGSGGGAVVTPPADTTPADTTPADTTPADTTPADTTPADTTPAETTAPVDTTTEPETTAPAVVDSEDVADSSEAEVTEPAGTTDDGCSGTIGFAGIAIVMALGLSATAVAKKKED